MLRIFFLAVAVSTASADYLHFEARHVHPIDLTPDGTHLLAVHSPGGSLSVFDVRDTTPVLILELPVGLEPVTVRARTNDEIWVVNEVSDSISIVSLAKRALIDTLQVPDEPGDIHFANDKAFVTCSRNRLVRVFNAETREVLGTIPLDGVYPRAMASSPDGDRLFVSFLLSGNGTTILPKDQAPAPQLPTNPDLPPAPRTALIVKADDPRIPWDVVDHDIAEIDTETLTVNRYLSGVGTHLFDLQVHPERGDLWIANSESLNLTATEPALQGEFIHHRLTEIDTEGFVHHHDLNPNHTRATEPDPEQIALALAQPTSLSITPGGSSAWVSAFNSDRVAEVDLASGEVMRRIDLRADGDHVRGPRGLSLHPDGERVFVLNKLSNTLSVIVTATGSVASESPLGSHHALTPEFLEGRGFLFDARLSGNGTMSCASCHLDADIDGLAWDLGDPGGEMVGVPGSALSAHITSIQNRQLHPMKGPMMTQTLRGLGMNDSSVVEPSAVTTTKFHWRGDKPSIQSFNSTFPNLMGGQLLSDENMDALANYLQTIVHHPNPHRRPDRTLPEALGEGSPIRGRDLFNDHLKSHCVVCHAYPGGTDQNLDLRREIDGTQDVKNPSLRTVYQRAGLFAPDSEKPSLAGFGLGSDGSGHKLPKVHFYQLDTLSTPQEIADLTAFILCFDTGTAPAVGRSVNMLSGQANEESVQDEIALLEVQAVGGACDLVVSGTIEGVMRRFRYDISVGTYLSDRAHEIPLARADLFTSMSVTDGLTFLGVMPGNGVKFVRAQDREPPKLHISRGKGKVHLEWHAPEPDWFMEAAQEFSGGWTPLAVPRQSDNIMRLDIPLAGDGPQFFRLRRTW